MSRRGRKVPSSTRLTAEPEHETNLEGWCVLVDHRTGAQYLYRYKYGVTPLLDADGTPLLVLEAGE